MKKDFDKSIKFKMSIIILLILSLIIQPHLVRGLQDNGYTLLEITWQILFISYYLFGLSILINEFIIRWVTVKIFRGIETKNKLEKISNVGLIVVSLTLFHSWLYEAMTNGTDISNLALACMLITFYIIFKDKSLIVCNDTILLGYKIIKINFVSEYKLTESNFMQMQRNKIILYLKNGETIEFIRDPISVHILEEYLEENRISAKSPIH